MKISSKAKQSVFATLRTDEHPRALAFDARGDLLLAIWNPDRLLGFDATGRRHTFAKVSYSAPLDGLAVDARGDVYAADFNGDCIRKIGASGSPVTIFASIQEPTSLVIGPAPKP